MEWELVKENNYILDVCEATPFVWEGRLHLMACHRPSEGRLVRDHFLTIRDATGRELISRFGEGHSLACLLVARGNFNVFASRWENDTWNDVTLFRSPDMRNWSAQVILCQEPPEHIFNTSACAVDDHFVMAYETNDPAYKPFSEKFARSEDLVNWERVEGAVFAPDRYAACPCLRFHDGYYYMLYTEHIKPRWWFEIYMVRSENLMDWEPSPRNPIVSPGEGEDINTSDPELVEFRGNTYLYYSIGDQRTYSKLKRARFEGPMGEFFEWCYEGT